MDRITGWELSRVGAQHCETASADRDARFTRLTDAHLDAACRLATVIFAGNRAEAEDAVQDAALRAWQHFDDLRDPDRFEWWFTRIVVNTCRDQIGARHVRVIAAADPDVEATPDHAEALTGSDALVRALRTLSPEHRVAVALRFLGDYSLDEIAARTGQRPGTVKSRLHYALRALRAALDAEAREVSR